MNYNVIVVELMNVLFVTFWNICTNLWMGNEYMGITINGRGKN